VRSLPLVPDRQLPHVRTGLPGTPFPAGYSFFRLLCGSVRGVPTRVHVPRPQTVLQRGVPRDPGRAGRLFTDRRLHPLDRTRSRDKIGDTVGFLGRSSADLWSVIAAPRPRAEDHQSRPGRDAHKLRARGRVPAPPNDRSRTRRTRCNGVREYTSGEAADHRGRLTRCPSSPRHDALESSAGRHDHGSPG